MKIQGYVLLAVVVLFLSSCSLEGSYEENVDSFIPMLLSQLNAEKIVKQEYSGAMSGGFFDSGLTNDGNWHFSFNGRTGTMRVVVDSVTGFFLAVEEDEIFSPNGKQSCASQQEIIIAASTRVQGIPIRYFVHSVCGTVSIKVRTDDGFMIVRVNGKYATIEEVNKDLRETDAFVYESEINKKNLRNIVLSEFSGKVVHEELKEDGTMRYIIEGDTSSSIISIDANSGIIQESTAQKKSNCLSQDEAITKAQERADGEPVLVKLSGTCGTWEIHIQGYDKSYAVIVDGTTGEIKNSRFYFN